MACQREVLGYLKGMIILQGVQEGSIHFTSCSGVGLGLLQAEHGDLQWTPRHAAAPCEYF